MINIISIIQWFFRFWSVNVNVPCALSTAFRLERSWTFALRFSTVYDLSKTRKSHETFRNGQECGTFSNGKKRPGTVNDQERLTIWNVQAVLNEWSETFATVKITLLSWRRYSSVTWRYTSVTWLIDRYLTVSVTLPHRYHDRYRYSDL